MTSGSCIGGRSSPFTGCRGSGLYSDAVSCRRARSTCFAFCTITPNDIMSGRLHTGSSTSSTTSANHAGLVVAAHTCVRDEERPQRTTQKGSDAPVASEAGMPIAWYRKTRSLNGRVANGCTTSGSGVAPNAPPGSKMPGASLFFFFSRAFFFFSSSSSSSLSSSAPSSFSFFFSSSSRRSSSSAAVTPTMYGLPPVLRVSCRRTRMAPCGRVERTVVDPLRSDRLSARSGSQPWNAKRPPAAPSGPSSGNSVSISAGSRWLMRTRPYATRCFSGLFHQTLRKTSGAPVPASCPSSGCGISTLVGFSFSPNVMKTSPPLSRMPFASYHIAVRTLVSAYVISTITSDPMPPSSGYGMSSDSTSHSST